MEQWDSHFHVELILPKPLKYPSYMPDVLLFCFRINQDIISICTKRCNMSRNTSLINDCTTEGLLASP